MLAVLGIVLAFLGLLGLLHAVALSLIVSVVLLIVGLALVVIDPRVRSRF